VLSEDEKISNLPPSERGRLAEKAVEAIIGKSRRKKSAADRTPEIEKRPRQTAAGSLSEMYELRRILGLVDRLRNFGELSKNISAQSAENAKFTPRRSVQTSSVFSSGTVELI